MLVIYRLSRKPWVDFDFLFAIPGSCPSARRAGRREITSPRQTIHFILLYHEMIRIGVKVVKFPKCYTDTLVGDMIIPCHGPGMATRLKCLFPLYYVALGRKRSRVEVYDTYACLDMKRFLHVVIKSSAVICIFGCTTRGESDAGIETKLQTLSAEEEMRDWPKLNLSLE